MAEFAVIKTGGKQYKVKIGDIIKVEKLSGNPSAGGKKLEFDDIFGGKKVTASILSEGKEKKVRILKQRPKKRYKKVQGHRQTLSQIRVEKIS
ncbi:hypothetical protein A2V71_04315 [Candidatus Berkelbacteria bacterium RBG_13_40_8]|uniref:Large ribosomal subunit protein bL21 n=1 Tax=Candidatus Berkelbacteria bacterium RBG_13_40_8 TaxID=1797467 RepID=A0A1F5DNY1_9BACT|nr:MAG: hypothetical protein A2V71_04315 [Candidatus Berkelbacteria bacterium RBG_13_40_8]